MTNLRTELQRKSSGACLQYAVLRIESALVIAGTILLMAFAPPPFGDRTEWIWLTLGVAGWGAVIYSSLTDPATSAKVIAQLLAERLELDKIEDRKLRGRIEAMIEYIRTVEVDLYRKPATPNHAALEEIAAQLYEWVDQGAIFARHADTYQRDHRLEQRQKELPGLIETQVARLKYEKNADIVERLNAEMEALGRDWQSLKQLDAQMQQADGQLSQSLAALARVTGEVHLIAAEHEIARDHIDRVRQEVQRYAGQIADLVTQIKQLYTDALNKG